jgi:hypothetical protein
MANSYTPEEVEQRYIEAMGPELGRLHNRLWNECVYLYVKWADFEILFGSKPERIELLNSAAPSFFWMLRDVMWENVILHIARLTDPHTSRSKKQNLTVNRLPLLVDPAVKPQIEELLAVVAEKCEFARDWRNRNIAHSDLVLALKESSAKPLEPASRASVKAALAAIAAVLNAVESSYTGNGPVAYERSAFSLGAQALLYVLRDGLQSRDDLERRRISGQLLPEDIAKQNEPI